ncbi:MAG: hypothetical protein GC168_07015 [Candidatus Hydrogenedens sp.]|nr:hypothetical protein [Candidatus Hydrogenedens sp.]
MDSQSLQAGGGTMPKVYGEDTFVLRRKVFVLFGASFHIYDSDGNVAFFSRQKAFRLRESIHVFADETMQTEVLTIKARQIIDFGASYDVIDALTGEMAGALRRKAFKSVLKDEWTILDADDREIGLVQEDSLLLALVRRFLSNLVPQSFEGTVGGRRVFQFRQHFNPFISKMTLDYSADSEEILDRRIGIAAAILLAAIEGRQK